MVYINGSTSLYVLTPQYAVIFLIKTRKEKLFMYSKSKNQIVSYFYIIGFCVIIILVSSVFLPGLFGMIISLIALTVGVAFAKDLLEYAIQTKKYNQEIDEAWANKIESQERLLSCLRLQQDKLEFKTQKSMALSKDADNELEILQLKVKEAKEFLKKIEEEIKKKSSVLETTNQTSNLFNSGKQTNILTPDLGEEDLIQKEMDNV